MKKNTLDKDNTTLEATPEKVIKAPYTKPDLRVFGSVSALTRGATGTQCDGQHPGSNNPKTAGICVSDRSTKENLVRVGTHALGIGLYLFDYKPEYRTSCGHGRQFGVMADEVETVMPEAVSLHPNGYKQVDYGMLGIRHTFH
jgi:hypothetical protein